MYQLNENNIGLKNYIHFFNLYIPLHTFPKCTINSLIGIKESLETIVYMLLVRNIHEGLDRSLEQIQKQNQTVIDLVTSAIKFKFSIGTRKEAIGEVDPRVDTKTKILHLRALWTVIYFIYAFLFM